MNNPKILNFLYNWNPGEVEKTFDGEELAFNFTRSDVGQFRCVSQNRLARIEKTIRIGVYGR